MKVEGSPVVTVSVNVSDDITTRVAVVTASVVAVIVDPLGSIVHWDGRPEVPTVMV